MPAHLERLDIAPSRLDRWEDAANPIGDAGYSLRRELLAVRADPTVHNFRRAANAARLIEGAATLDVQRQMAMITAIEIENDAGIRL